MTPLAQEILRQGMLAPSKRKFADHGRLLDQFHDVHCFECTEAREAGRAVGVDMMKRETALDECGFLPAPKTWIEWRSRSGGRFGVLLQERRDEWFSVHMAMSDGELSGSSPNIDFLPLKPRSVLAVNCLTQRRMSDAEQGGVIAEIYGLLAVINSPKIIGRRMHAPHKGLARTIASSRLPISKYPLNAWSEILLKVAPPRDESGREPREAWLTGERALHFCRAHLRIRYGKLEFVSAHWRGNEDLGVKRARYVVSM